MISFSSRQVLVATAIASVTLIGVVSVQADTNSTKVRSIVQGNYDKINAAFIKQDLDTVTSYFTPDYISINDKGERQNVQEFRSYYSNLFKRMKIDITSNKTTIKSIAIDSKGAQVSTEQLTEGKLIGNNKIAIRQTSQSLWTNTPQGWRMKESKVLTNKTTFNGKVFKG
jgi:ketosteroid isomerase-like protein